MNPPNCPKLRPIEEFWSIVKGKLKKNGGSANDMQMMGRKWKIHADKVSPTLVQKLMGAIKKRVRSFAYGNDN